jgi:plasmid stabilization system protein ParE
MTIVVTRAARRDLIEAYDFIAAHSPDAAGRVLDRLFSVIRRIDAGELKGPEVRLEDGRRARRWSVPPFRIYYRRSTRRTVVVRVYHQARRPIER